MSDIIHLTLMGIMTGLLTMSFWGVGIFLTALATRKLENVLTLFWIQIFGFSLAIIYFIFKHTSFNITLIYNFIPLLIIIAILQVIAYLAFYSGLAKGQVSLVSPLGASWGLITALLGILFFKESLKMIQLFSIFLIIVGIFLISIDFKDLINYKKVKLFLGVKEGVISMLAWGVSLFLLASTTKTLGWFMPAFIFRFFVLLLLVIYIISTKKYFIPKSKKFPLKLLFLSGMLDMLAFFTYSIGVSKTYASIVAPIATANTLITVLLATIFLKERLRQSQIIGIVGIVGGLILISI